MMRSQMRIRWSLVLREFQIVLMTGSLLILRGMQCSCPSERIFTNCTTPPCSLDVDLMAHPTNFSNSSKTTRQGFKCANGAIDNENLTCVNDFCGGCFARYFAADGAEIFCNSKIVTLCQWDKPFNLTCSYSNWKIKIWYAVMRNAHQPIKTQLRSASLRDLSNSSLSHQAQRTCTHSVLYEVSKRCDGKHFCKLSVLDIRSSFDPCPQTNKAIVQLDYTCYTDAPTSNASQVRFFTMGLVLIGSLFPISLLVLLITVQVKKFYFRDAYDMNNVHLPLTDNENPEF